MSGAIAKHVRTTSSRCGPRKTGSAPAAGAGVVLSGETRVVVPFRQVARWRSSRRFTARTSSLSRIGRFQCVDPPYNRSVTSNPPARGDQGLRGRGSRSVLLGPPEQQLDVRTVLRRGDDVHIVAGLDTCGP